MAYASPSVAPSGATFAQFQAAGAAGQLDLLIQANQGGTSSPTAAPTVSATGGGATGGILAAGTYYATFTETNGFGETTASPESAQFTVAAGDIPVLTFPALQAGNVARSVYLTPAGGASGTEVLYARDVTTNTFALAAAAPGSNYASPPPLVNTTIFTALNFDLVRAPRRMKLDRAFARLRQIVVDFNEGRPMVHAQEIANFRAMHGLFALLDQLCKEIGTLMDANPGHINPTTTSIGGVTPRRTWP